MQTIKLSQKMILLFWMLWIGLLPVRIWKVLYLTYFSKKVKFDKVKKLQQNSNNHICHVDLKIHLYKLPKLFIMIPGIITSGYISAVVLVTTFILILIAAGHHNQDLAQCAIRQSDQLGELFIGIHYQGVTKELED